MLLLCTSLVRLAGFWPSFYGDGKSPFLRKSLDIFGSKSLPDDKKTTQVQPVGTSRH
jgi:hypothetical protein